MIPIFICRLKKYMQPVYFYLTKELVGPIGSILKNNAARINAYRITAA
jgi:hypothetical protein